MTAPGICPVCDGRDLEPFFDSVAGPIPPDVAGISRDRVDLSCCPRCGLVVNAAFDETHPPASSVDFASDFEETVAVLVGEHDVVDSRIIEIGCGQGAFLRRLVEMGGGNRGYGFDPAYRGPLEDLDGRVQFAARRYGEAFEPVTGDVVVARHVLETTRDPLGLLRTMHAAVADAKDGRVFVEIGSAETSLRSRSLLDFDPGQCCRFSAGSLMTALERAGFRVEIARHFGHGRHVRVEARAVAEPVDVSLRPGPLPLLAAAARANAAEWLDAASGPDTAVA